MATFSRVKTSWNSPAFLTPMIVQQRNQNGRGDGDKLSPGYGERGGDDVGREKRKDWKRSQNPHQSGDHGGDRCRLGDHKPSPGIEKAAERAVGIAHIHILSAGLRLHRAKFGISERAKKRQQPAHEPRQIHELGRADRLHHFRGNQKNSAADDGSDDHGGGVADAQVAGKLSGTLVERVSVRPEMASISDGEKSCKS